ncbi:MAG: recombination protein O N-terminal domain-containing protein, partial [Candidatus Delongbacteria bacterium]|nr:recombination protein O N-terminal domain-containing protein [Candidatus Delongbacteria bacterium]
MIEEINTEGIIIRSSKHGENGRLLNFITKDNGMISVVKHGFTSKKNTGRSILQPMHFIKLELVYERKKYKINDFELLDNYANVKNSYEKTDAILNIFAVLNKLPLNDLDGNSMIFHLV